MYRRSQRWMLIINNRFLSLYDYNFLLVIEKIFSVNSKICLYECCLAFWWTHLLASSILSWESLDRELASRIYPSVEPAWRCRHGQRTAFIHWAWRLMTFTAAQLLHHESFFWSSSSFSWCVHATGKRRASRREEIQIMVELGLSLNVLSF